jgi:hypothetical protein
VCARLRAARVDVSVARPPQISQALVTPGCYDGICFELDIVGLAVNTVTCVCVCHVRNVTDSCAAVRFSRRTRSALTRRRTRSSPRSLLLPPPIDRATRHRRRALRSREAAGTGVSAIIDEVSGLRSLKKLVTRWSIDVAGASESVEALLGNVYRWLCDERALSHDPALRRYVHAMMDGVLRALVDVRSAVLWSSDVTGIDRRDSGERTLSSCTQTSLDSCSQPSARDDHTCSC